MAGRGHATTGRHDEPAKSDQFRRCRAESSYGDAGGVRSFRQGRGPLGLAADLPGMAGPRTGPDGHCGRTRGVENRRCDVNRSGRASGAWWGRAVVAVAAVLLVVVLAGGGWATWRLRASLPLLEAQVAAPELSAPVTVARDAQGVPTLTGRDRSDVAWALGYLHGQERFFQMDGQRRTAAGELSELAGRAALRRDRAIRLHRFR